MKLFFYTCFVLVSLAACQSAEQQPEVVKMDPKDIAPGPVVHDSLSAEQMEKVKRIQKTFAEVFPASLDETVTNFKRDQNPDKEIAIWLNMAAVYEGFIRRHPGVDPVKKQEAFKLLLLRSTMPEEEAVKEADLTVLSEAETSELLRNYNAGTSPIVTQVK